MKSALNLNPKLEVPLSRSPLVRVIAQIRFPVILAIRNPDRVAEFQEDIRRDYPYLVPEQFHRFEISGYDPPNVGSSMIWRMTDCEKRSTWRVSLGVDFLALETSSYVSRTDFLTRLSKVTVSLQQAFDPASVGRFGLRYVDRLTGDALSRIDQLIHSSVLGITASAGKSENNLGNSVVHIITEAQFLALENACILGRWGHVAENTTYDPNVIEPYHRPCWILDLDMHSTQSQPFESNELLATAAKYAEYLYSLFREMVTENFLRFYGGKL